MADYRSSPLTQSDLQFSYSPRAAGGDNPALRGTPDNDLLNRGESYEVLYFVNAFAHQHGSGKAGVALKAERLIQRYLPSTVRSRANVAQWLLNNWDKHGDAPIT